MITEHTLFIRELLIEQKRIEAWIAIHPDDIAQIIASNREYEEQFTKTAVPEPVLCIPHSPVSDT